MKKILILLILLFAVPVLAIPPTPPSSGGTGDVTGPATNTDGKIPQWNGANSKDLKDGLSLSTDTSLGTSDTTVSSQKAVKTYADTKAAKGTLTNGKWCTTDGSVINCTEDEPVGTGDVTKVGTPTEHQQAVWTGDGTIKGVTVTGSKVMCTDANGEPVACTNLTDVAFSGYVPTSWIVRAGTNNVLTYTGDYSLGITLSGATSVTFPTTGTLATTSQLATDNSTANNLVAKDSDGHIENLTLDSHLSRTGTTSPALAVVTPTVTYASGEDTGPTAAQMSGNGVIVKNYGQAAADIFVPLPAAAAGLSGLFTVVTAQANHWGVQAAANDKIYLVAAAGTIAAGDNNACVTMVAAQLGQSFACWTQATGETTHDWFCRAIAIGTSTFAAHAAP